MNEGASGYYGSEMIIGVDNAQNAVTGYFKSTSGWDEELGIPRFSCRFYFSGKAIQDSYTIKSWHPGEDRVIEGSLTFENQMLRIKLNEEHGGCPNVRHFASDEGTEFRLSSPGNWTSIAMVSDKKAYFYQAPDLSTRRNSYLIQGDVVKIFQLQNGWVDAEFGQESIRRGWIKVSDLYLYSRD
ncbi:hypothetical protein [Crocosphaera subtropica]|nr:hypothetical protein [Crocosphaera subtropica]